MDALGNEGGEENFQEDEKWTVVRPLASTMV
jgi:hypothetical protein